MTHDELIKILISIVSALFLLAGALIMLLHKDITKKIDKIDDDLKPTLRKLDVHDVRIGQLEENHKEINTRLNTHEVAINELKKQVR
jgi:Co/Zn/Cd efflux system component